MSLTVIVFISVYIAGIILTLYHPIYGILLYLFEWHNHPPYWWWGRDWPDPGWSILIATLTVISVIINRKKLTKFLYFKYEPFIWLVLIVINSYFVSFIFAIDPSESFRKSEILLKLAINFFLMFYIIRNPLDYKMVIFIILLGVANFGRIAWEEGSHRDLGVIAPGATSGNLIAAYMMSIVPIFGIAFLYGKKFLKIFTVISLPFVLNALILENSRGTILGLVSMGLLMPFFVKGKTRITVIGALIIAGLIFIQLTNKQFWERQKTTINYEEEQSAVSRLHLWRGGLRFLEDYPFGGGGESFESLSINYVPELKEIMEKKGQKTVHNTFLLVATEWGYQGLFLFLGWLIHTYLILFRIKRNAINLSDFNFYNLHAIGLIVVLTGALVAGIFSNRQYAENIYWFSAFAIALRNIQFNDKIQLEEFQEAKSNLASQESNNEPQLTTPRIH